MAKFLFLDKTAEPTEENLKEALSTAYKYWVVIKEEVCARYGDMTTEWRYYDKKSGWTLKNIVKKRNLFFFKPYNGYFNLTFIFGEKAVAEIAKSSVSAKLIRDLPSAKKFAEGRALTVTVSKKSDVHNVFTLVDVKIRH